MPLARLLTGLAPRRTQRAQSSLSRTRGEHPLRHQGPTGAERAAWSQYIPTRAAPPMATAAAAVATRLACNGIEDQMTKDLGDDWLCSPPPPPGLAAPDASDGPPEASTAWSDEAEAVLRTEVAGQRHKFADVHWGRAATAVRRATGYVLTAQEARERYEGSDREVSLLGAARSRPFWRRRLSRRAVVATPVEEDEKKRLSGGRKGKT